MFGIKKEKNNSVVNGVNIVDIYAKQYTSVDMIKAIAAKMCDKYLRIIDNEINKMDTNESQIAITYELSRMGVIFVKPIDGGQIDVAYKDWGYTAIENEKKRLGVAIALKDIVISNIKEQRSFVEIINTNISENYGWIEVRLNIKLIRENKLKSL